MCSGKSTASVCGPVQHCAPLMHRALGTVEQGVVRFSFSHTNTRQEALAAACAVRSLAEE